VIKKVIIQPSSLPSLLSSLLSLPSNKQYTHKHIQYTHPYLAADPLVKTDVSYVVDSIDPLA
jgi:hypothetical protein